MTVSNHNDHSPLSCRYIICEDLTRSLIFPWRYTFNLSQHTDIYIRLHRWIRGGWWPQSWQDRHSIERPVSWCWLAAQMRLLMSTLVSTRPVSSPPDTTSVSPISRSGSSSFCHLVNSVTLFLPPLPVSWTTRRLDASTLPERSLDSSTRERNTRGVWSTMSMYLSRAALGIAWGSWWYPVIGILLGVRFHLLGRKDSTA